MTTKDEALKLALEFVDSVKVHPTQIATRDAIHAAIKQALAAPVQDLSRLKPFVHGLGKAILRELMDAPPAAQKPWVGLTDDEMYWNCPNWLSHEQCKTWVQQIEAKLKEKNRG